MSKTIEHILVPTDFSDASERAFCAAVHLARPFDARITLMHAWSLPSLAYAEGVTWPIYDLEDAAKQALQEAFTRGAPMYPKTELLLREGNDCKQILATVKERGCDLIVMGTHGRRGIARALLGSVAEKVVRLSHVPVVTVEKPAGAARTGIARILVPTDFSPTSDRALEVAIGLARTFRAKLTLLHVWSVPATSYSEGLSWPLVGMETAAQRALDDLRAETAKLHPDTEAVLRHGGDALCIVQMAQERASDLIVMGTHGRRGLPRLLIGSIAAKVLRLSPVPVMTIATGGEARPA